VTIPSNAALLTFDFAFANEGDGDSLTVHFNGTLLWSYRGNAFSGSDPVQGAISVRALAGQTGRLLFTLQWTDNALF
jgi:hypothetical protein